jgi:hypothetical protein
VNLPDRVAHVEQRQQTGGVPGGAGGELLALDENHVAPALPGEVVEGPHPDDAAPDDDHPSLRFHERAILLLCCPVGGRHPSGLPERSPSSGVASNANTTICVAGASWARGGIQATSRPLPQDVEGASSLPSLDRSPSRGQNAPMTMLSPPARYTLPPPRKARAAFASSDTTYRDFSP